MDPKVSVIMPTYNAEKYIGVSIESILQQSYKNFELIVVNDGSEDRTASVIKKYKDSRINYYEHDLNMGISDARNTGLSLANGVYIAWLDSDDLSHPDRIGKQVKVLDAHKSIGLCGTWVQTIGDIEGNVWKYPTNPDVLHCRMLFDNPFATSSVMMRRECIDNPTTIFDPVYSYAEDYDLWERISHKWQMANVPEIITYYRIHSTQTSKAMAKKQLNSIWRIQSRILEKLGFEASENEKNIHLNIGVGWASKLNLEEFCDTEDWLLKLYYANLYKNVFPTETFKEIISDRYYMAYCAVSKHKEFREKAFKTYRNSKISRWSGKMLLRAIKKVFKA